MKKITVNVPVKTLKALKISTKQDSFTMDELRKLAVSYQVPISEFFKPNPSVAYHAVPEIPVESNPEKVVSNLGETAIREVFDDAENTFLDMANKLNIKPEKLKELGEYLLKRKSS